MERRLRALVEGRENEFDLLGKEIADMANVLLKEHNVPGLSKRAEIKPRLTASRSVFTY